MGRQSREGARYISQITVEDNKIQFIGQADQYVTFTLDELRNISVTGDPNRPIVIIANASNQPSPGPGLKYEALGGVSNYPILQYSGMNFWGTFLNRILI